MEIQINISATARAQTNSLNRPIAQTQKGIANFYKWFGKSKAIDVETRPLVLYHGGNESIHRIDTQRFGKGNDQLGSGFYLTTSPHDASNYTKQDGGNVMPVYASITKPVPELGHLPRIRIFGLIKAAPQLDEVLWNFGDYVDGGKERTINSVIDSYYEDQSTIIETLNAISNDFYSGDEGLFLRNVYMRTGYDGIIRKYGNVTHYVVWFPNQIKSVNNVGTSDKTNHSIIAYHEN